MVIEGNMEGRKAKRGTEEKVGQTSKKSRGLNTGPPQHGGKPSGEGGRQKDRETVQKRREPARKRDENNTCVPHSA